MPSELTAAQARLAAAFHGRQIVFTKKGVLAKLIAGLGWTKWRLGGISLCSSVRAALIRPAMPAAASRWPMLVFTEPMAQNCFGCPARRKARVRAAISTGSPIGGGGAVGLDAADGFRLDLGHGDGVGCCGRLAVGAGGPVAEFRGAVVVDRRAADDGVDVVAVANGIRQRLQQDQARPAAEKRSRGVGVKGAAMPVGGEQGLGGMESSPCGAGRGR